MKTAVSFSPAHDEATGHAHALKAESAALLRDPRLMTVFMKITDDAPVALEHDEHSTVTLPPGHYRVIRQREYTRVAIVDVAD